jgi:hypothetical protein
LPLKNIWAPVGPTPMLRCRPESGLALLLLAELCLPMRESMAQSAVAKSASDATRAPSQPEAQAHHKQAAPGPPAPQTPAPPLTLEQLPPMAPKVSYRNGQLVIISQNATLSQVLRSVQLLTGASVDMPAGASNERVVAQLGPGKPRDVLNALLNGSNFNYIILGVTGNPGAVQKVILTTPEPASTVKHGAG